MWMQWTDSWITPDYNMKKITISEPYLPKLDDLIHRLSDIWSSKWLTNDGPNLVEFENKLREYLGAEYLSVQNNGHSSLEVGLRALEVKGEIITTPYSFVSTSLAIRNTGSKVVYADISKGGVNIDPHSVKKMISDKTTAIVAVHTYGIPCDIPALTKITREYGIKLIFDGAHSFGVQLENTPISRFGDMTMFSFHATKLFHCIEGGALVVQDSALLDRAKKIRNFGITGPDSISGEGTNAKLNELLAAVGLLNLKAVDLEIHRRTELANLYTQHLAGIDEISCLTIPTNITWNYSYFPIFFDLENLPMNTFDIEAALKDSGILARRYFSTSLNTIDIFQDCKGAGQCENSEALAQRVLCLPIHGGMTDDDVLFVCDRTKEILGR